MIQHKLLEISTQWHLGNAVVQWDDRHSSDWMKKSLADERARLYRGAGPGLDTQKYHDQNPVGITSEYIKYAARSIANDMKDLGIGLTQTKGNLNLGDYIQFDVPSNMVDSPAVAKLLDGTGELNEMVSLMMMQGERSLETLDWHAFDFGSVTDLPALDGSGLGSVTLPYEHTWMELRNPAGNTICCAAESLKENTSIHEFIRSRGIRVDHSFSSWPVIMTFWVYFPKNKTRNRAMSVFYREFVIIGMGAESGDPEVMVIAPSNAPMPESQHISKFGKLGQNVTVMARHFMHCLEVLNASGVERQTIPAPARLNAKRAKAGKPPIVEFHTLSIYRVKDRQVLGQREPTGRPGNMKKGHWRRAHLRTYKDDRYVNVKGQSVLIEQQWIGGGGPPLLPEKEYEVKSK